MVLVYSGLADVQSKLVGDPRFSTVDVLNDVVPTLAQLQAYDVVFVYLICCSPTALGDVLADYAEAGGAVVDAVYTNLSRWSLKEIPGA